MVRMMQEPIEMMRNYGKCSKAVEENHEDNKTNARKMLGQMDRRTREQGFQKLRVLSECCLFGQINVDGWPMHGLRAQLPSLNQP